GGARHPHQRGGRDRRAIARGRWSRSRGRCVTKLRGGALVFVAIVLISLNLRTAIMGFVPVLDVIGADIGFGATAAGVLATVPTFVFGVIALAGPMLFRLAGGELLLTISAAATTVGIVTRS